MIGDFVYRETWYRGTSKEGGAAEFGTFTKPLTPVMIFSLFFNWRSYDFRSLSVPDIKF